MNLDKNMKIAIISAMEKERKLLLPIIEELETIEYQGLEVSKGRVGPHEVVLARCGIGKVNAAINTYKVISSFRPQLMLNSGVAGGASKRTRIGDVMVADYVAYHDVWCGPGTQPGVADGMDVFMACDPEVIKLSYKLLEGERLQVGLICSGDKFIESKEEIMEIHKLYPEVLAVDMESAAIAQVCEMCGVKFNIIRVVSDTPGEGSNVDQYQNFWKEAPEKSFTLIKRILAELKED